MSKDKSPIPAPVADSAQDEAAKEAALLKQPAEADEVGGPKGPNPPATATGRSRDAAWISDPATHFLKK
ncbi:hypothetical protein RI056_11470 [Komagataeibacter nataicola]|nr:hypothetical protein [Komagataeibacter nataicola]WNM07679.1 hypothetical protein RI056_11470 [Komagataeibacter nataicola]